MPKIALVGPYNQVMKDAFYESVPDKFSVIEISDETQYDTLYAANPEYILNRTSILTDKDINACTNLKMIAKYAVGYDNIDVEAAARKGIPVVNCNGFNSDSVAELTILHMLALLRNLMPQNQALRENHWSQDEYVSSSFLLKDQTVGIIGLGNIGSRVAKLVNAFGGRVIYYDIARLSAEDEAKCNVEFMTFEELLKTADIVTLHMPGGEDTDHMISSAQLKLMKKGSILINCARGTAVDERAVCEALKSGHLFGSGFDVFENEPPIDDPVLAFKNVIATPHVGGSTYGIGANMVRFCVNNILSFEDGKELPLQNIVNRDLLQTAKA